ncbi:uncharacterized protein LOC117011394 [Catharus ustulatus]|uniref:uncharacterized protein LOC117011394 n=1 Tax=Catharus ustulatus TaxID=91951 RepID=UPI001C5B111C|nr:uncharacterized protein LOC117011394 [Catharus ustulatus]
MSAALVLTVYILTFTVGFPANVFTLAVLVAKSRRRPAAPPPDHPCPVLATLTTADLLLLNLTAADLLLLLVLPFKMAEAAAGLVWPLPAALCPVANFCFYTSMYLSSLSLAALSVQRYLGVAFPLRLQGRRRPGRALAVIGLIWLLAGGHCSVVFVAEFTKTAEVGTGNRSAGWGQGGVGRLRVDPVDLKVDPVDLVDHKVDAVDLKVDPIDPNVDPIDPNVDPIDSKVGLGHLKVNPVDHNVDHKVDPVDLIDHKVDPVDPIDLNVDRVDHKVDPVDPIDLNVDPVDPIDHKVDLIDPIDPIDAKVGLGHLKLDLGHLKVNPIDLNVDPVDHKVNPVDPVDPKVGLGHLKVNPVDLNFDPVDPKPFNDVDLKLIDPNPKTPKTNPKPNPNDPIDPVDLKPNFNDPKPNPNDPNDPVDLKPNFNDPKPNFNDPLDPKPNPKPPKPNLNDPNDPKPNFNDPKPNPIDPVDPKPNPNDPKPNPNDPIDPKPNPNDPKPTHNPPAAAPFKCYDDFSEEQLRYVLPLRLEFFFILFLIPFSTTIFCYVGFVRALLARPALPAAKRRRAVGLAVATMVIFGLCFAPYNVSHVVGFWQGRSPGWRVYATLLSGLNAALDPLVFYFSSGAVRQALSGAGAALGGCWARWGRQ